MSTQESILQAGIVAHIAVPIDKMAETIMHAISILSDELSQDPNREVGISRWESQRIAPTKPSRLTAARLTHAGPEDRLMGAGFAPGNPSISIRCPARHLEELVDPDRDILTIRSVWSGTTEEVAAACRHYTRIAQRLLGIGEVLAILVDADGVFDWQRDQLYPRERPHWRIEHYESLIPGYGWFNMIGERLATNLASDLKPSVVDGSGRGVITLQLGDDPMDHTRILEQLPDLRTSLRPLLAGWIVDGGLHRPFRCIEGLLTTRDTGLFADEILRGRALPLLLDETRDSRLQRGITFHPTAFESGEHQWELEQTLDADPDRIQAAIRSSCVAIERSLSDGWFSGYRYEWAEPTVDGLIHRWSTSTSNLGAQLQDFSLAAGSTPAFLTTPSLTGDIPLVTRFNVT